MSRVVALGEIMARLATPGYRRFQQAMPGRVDVTFAGAEASIAASLAYLGAEASFVTALPEHAIADACVANLRSMGVGTESILRTATGRLGLYFLEHGVNQRGGNVIYDRDGSAMAITPPEAYDWPAIFAGCEWFVISGITPAISRNGAEVTRAAIAAAKRAGARVVFDMNYRSKLWRWEPRLAPVELARQTIRALLGDVDWFVGGPSDVASVLDIENPAPSPTNWSQLARRLVDEFPAIQRVAMTLRDGSTSAVQLFGGALFDSGVHRLELAPRRGGNFQPYEIATIVDRLGAGDAFTAGLIFAALRDELSSPPNSIAFAAAAGCLAHSIEGDFHYSTRAEIESLMAGESGGRVSR